MSVMVNLVPLNTSTSRYSGRHDSFTKYIWPDESTTVSSYPYPGISWTDSKEGYKNLIWRQQVAAHVSATTPFTGRSNTLRSRPCRHFVTHNWGPGWGPQWDGVLANYIETQLYCLQYASDNLNSLSETKADNEAKRKYVNAIRGKQTTFQGGTFLAELAKAVHSIRNPAQTLRRYLDSGIGSIKKRTPQLRALKRKLRRQAVADTWLELQYHWQPVIRDISDAVDAYAEAMGQGVGRYSPVHGVGVDRIATHSGPYTDAPAGVGSQYMIQNTSEVYVRYLGQVDCSLLAVSNLRKQGYDPSNWLPTAWEVVPWSFLIDYFTNIGDIISSASLAQSGLRYTNKTVRKRRTVQIYNILPVALQSTAYNVYLTTHFIPPVFSHSIRRVDRSQYTGSFVPTLEISIPGLGTKWLNMAALLAGRRDMRKLLRY